jgi:hypothetical protein
MGQVSARRSISAALTKHCRVMRIAPLPEAGTSYNGTMEVHGSLLSVVLNDQSQIEKEESQEMQVPKR